MRLRVVAILAELRVLVLGALFHHIMLQHTRDELLEDTADYRAVFDVALAEFARRHAADLALCSTSVNSRPIRAAEMAAEIPPGVPP